VIGGRGPPRGFWEYLAIFDNMANLTIHQPEILFLQDAVIRKYCELTRVDALQFRRSLTGTMKHYMNVG